MEKAVDTITISASETIDKLKKYVFETLYC